MLRIPFFKNIIFVATILVCLLFYNFYGKKSYTFYGDALGYYLYLPSTFIYHNLQSIEQLPTDKQIDQSVIHYTQSIPNLNPKSPTGYYVNQYTYGVALMELPFFAIAHFYEKVNHLEANGYSSNYMWLIKLSSLFYALMGLILTYKILLFFTDSFHALLSTSLILLASNLFWFSLYQAGMSHIPLFFLYACLIYTSIKVHQTPRLLYFIVLGFCVGLITVIRPTDILCMIIPLLYNIYNKETFNHKIAFIRTHALKILWAACCFIAVMIPQCLYWKLTTGSFLYYSYGTQTFNWLHPQVFKGLFSASNGWLIYSPLFFLSVIGIIYWRQFKSLALVYCTLFPIYIYVIYCWFCYNYINGFGSRPMIHLYALLAVVLAVFLQNVFKSKRIYQLLTGIFLLMCVSVNIAQSMQQARGDLYSEESHFLFNFNTLFKSNLTYNDLVLLDVDEKQPNQELRYVNTLGSIQFADSINLVQDSLKVKYVEIGQNEFPSIIIKTSYKKSLVKDAKYFKCNGYFKNTKDFYDWYQNHLLVFSIQRNQQVLLWKAIKINNKIGIDSNSHDIHLMKYRKDKWGYTPFYIRIPDNIAENDEIQLSIWNIGHHDLLVHAMSLEVYK